MMTPKQEAMAYARANAGKLREKVKQYLIAHPGSTRKEVKAALPNGLSNLSYYVKKDYIHYELDDQGRQLLYVGPAPAKAPKPTEPIAWFGPTLDEAPKSPTENEVLAYITDHRGKSLPELELALGDVSAHLGNLKQQNLIHITRLDRNRYYPTEPKAETTTTDHPMVGEIVNCEVCGRPFEIAAVNVKTKHYYCGDHAEQHNLYDCPECGKSFATPLNLQSHIRLSHTEEGREQQKMASARGGQVAAELRRVGKIDVEAMAKEFVWETGNTNLKQFIAWYKEKMNNEATN